MQTVVLAAVVIAALIALLLWMERIERRRRRTWYRAYFHEGGLVRSLMSRWRPMPRLTDQRADEGAAPTD